ncbi:MAG: FMN-binding glutamate synthase family protein [Gemmatimonadota bacterium]|nr:FMN-binding glutamate synthase family protein [Gemmatimonadota bacterium]
MTPLQWLLIIVVVALLLVIVYDLIQKKHAILRNFPIIGHFRYLLEAVGPELRQYIVTSNNEERPFSRDQRRWIYASAKRENTYFGFGTDEMVELEPNFLVIKHAAFAPEQNDAERAAGPTRTYAFPVVNSSAHAVPCAKVLGGHRGRAQAFRPESVVNISGMSYGSLSAPAVEAINRGVVLAGCLQNTGEGGVSPYHKKGGDLIWQIGTGYFGCRTDDGGFSKERFLETVAEAPVRAVEIKMSQGAKPGLGGMLPAAKVTGEIASIRGVPPGRDVISPSHHTAFSNVDELLDFVEELAEATGLPVGIKSAVGESQFWRDLAVEMAKGGRGVDFIAIDGGEGGTGAAPLAFSDHVALPFKIAFTRVYRIFAEEGVAEQVVWIGSGKLGFPETALLAFSFGCDLIAVGREAMMAVGCIQAQRCHTGHCPTGVATQSRWLMRGLDPTSKAARLANYVVALRKELLLLSRACGVAHPGLVSGDHIEILDDHFGSKDLWEIFGYEKGWGLPGPADRDAIRTLMAGKLLSH